MLDRIEFLVSEALIALRRNTWMTFAAVTTVAMALFLLGGLGYSYLRVSAYVNELKASYQIRIFLKSAMTQEEIGQAKAFVQQQPGVNLVRYISRDEGLKRFAAKNPGIDITDLKADNPLPDSFEVTVTDITKVTDIADVVNRQKWVEQPNGVQNSGELQTFLQDTLSQVRILGVLIGGLMLATGGVLIYNAIRLTIMARRREMRIMELVGASKFTIITPLLLEGLVQGFLGGALAYLFLYSTLAFAQSAVANLDAFTRIEQIPIFPGLFWFLIAGASYGVICSLIAVRDKRRQAATQ